MYGVVVAKQVSVSKLSFEQKWIMRETYEKEMRDNWAGAFEVIDQRTAPPNASIVVLQTVHKNIKDGGKLRLKA